MHEKKIVGLGQVDLEVAKTSLLCKLIVKTMKPEESIIQLVLQYRLVSFNPQRERSLDVSLDWFTSEQHQGLPRCKVWSHIRLGGTW